MLDAVCCVVCAGGGDDTMLTMAWSKIGDYYADRQRWTKALQYYGQAKELEKMVSASYMLEDFSGIERIMQARPLSTALHCSAPLCRGWLGSAGALTRA